MHGQQVGQRLAGVVQNGEHVDDGDRGVRGELGEHRVGPGADAERGDVPREDVGGVAQGLSARELQVFGAQHRGWPPSSWMPTSKESRVRVEGCSKSSATLRPASAWEASGAAFSSTARSSSACSSAALSSVPVR